MRKGDINACRTSRIEMHKEQMENIRFYIYIYIYIVDTKGLIWDLRASVPN